VKEANNPPAKDKHWDEPAGILTLFGFFENHFLRAKTPQNHFITSLPVRNDLLFEPAI
jgi:hypothetical protein